jgi:plastocyanin
MKRILFREILCGLLALAFIVLFAPKAKATPAGCDTTWTANVGAETHDESVQADAFFVNELWIYAGDCIQWTWIPQNEIHTVTLLTVGQVRPAAPTAPGVGGCAAPNPYPLNTINPYNGSACVSSAAVDAATAGAETFTVEFTNPGEYKFVCLIHTDMTGTVHVLTNSLPAGPFYAATLPYSRLDYTRKARDEADDILNDNDADADKHRKESDDSRNNEVIAGTGEIVATGGGLQYRAVMRFLKGTIDINEGDSVTWTNLDPTEPHTVTFGTEPVPFADPAPVNVKFAADGSLTATIACSTDNPACDYDYQPGASHEANTFLSSGFLQATPPDTTDPANTAQLQPGGGTGASPAPGTIPSFPPGLKPGVTRISITFPKGSAGTYYYHCDLHDVVGMTGKVVVHAVRP